MRKIIPKMDLDWKTAENFMTDAFAGVGVSSADAEICTDVLLESDRCGIPNQTTDIESNKWRVFLL